MNKNIRYYFAVIATFLASSLYAASYEDGLAAYEEKDYDDAVEIWENLAKQGDVASLLKMAEYYSAGFYIKKDEIVKRDPAVAFKLYQQAADQGSILPSITRSSSSAGTGRRSIRSINSDRAARRTRSSI